MKGWWIPVICVLAMGGGLAITEMLGAPSAAPITVKRTALIEELDKGFLISCHQKENPYPYRRAGGDDLAKASVEAGQCFAGTRGWPEDRVRKK